MATLDGFAGINTATLDGFAGLEAVAATEEA